jgi:hypothetical protein
MDLGDYVSRPTEFSMTTNVPEPLRSRLSTYCLVEAREGLDVLRRIVHSENPPPWVAPFREQLAEAIAKKSISARDYESLTGDDYETADEVASELRQIWSEVFGSTPPA